MPVYKRYKGRRIDSKHPRYAEARWWVEFRMKGKHILQAVPEARTQKEAERAETSIREDLYANRYRTGKEIGFSEYFDKHYLPWAQLNKTSVRDDAGSRGKELKAFFRSMPLRTITTSDCERLKHTAMRKQKRRAAKGEKRSDATINRIMALCSRVFTRAIIDRVTDLHPCKGIQKEDEGDGRTRSLTPDEYHRLTAALIEDLSYLHDVITVALGTGLRRGELLALKVQSVNLTENATYMMVKGQSVEVLPNCLLVPAQGRSKRKYTRTVPLCASVRAALVGLIGNRSQSELVFTKQANGVNDYSLRNGFEQACFRAEIPHGINTNGGVIFHDLRRTFATRLRANNVHPYDISFLLGHQIQGITKTYARESISNLRQSIKALDEPWGEVISFRRERAMERASS